MRAIARANLCPAILAITLFLSPCGTAAMPARHDMPHFAMITNNSRSPIVGLWIKPHNYPRWGTNILDRPLPFPTIILRKLHLNAYMQFIAHGFSFPIHLTYCIADIKISRTVKTPGPLAIPVAFATYKSWNSCRNPHITFGYKNLSR